MPEVINYIWKPPPPDENQWCVMIGGVRLTVNALSHQKAKAIAVDYLSSCCGDPLAYRYSIMSRISEKWRGGIRAKLRHRGSPNPAFHVEQKSSELSVIKSGTPPQFNGGVKP